MKNMNSFKAIQRAIKYEAERQMDILDAGKEVMQETRRWDDNKGESYAMRSKENAQDYRYFPELRYSGAQRKMRDFQKESRGLGLIRIIRRSI